MLLLPARTAAPLFSRPPLALAFWTRLSAALLLFPPGPKPEPGSLADDGFEEGPGCPERWSRCFQYEAVVRAVLLSPCRVCSSLPNWDKRDVCTGTSSSSAAHTSAASALASVDSASRTTIVPHEDSMIDSGCAEFTSEGDDTRFALACTLLAHPIVRRRFHMHEQACKQASAERSWAPW